MEQKKKEQDVLIVKDEKTGEIGVVAGLKRDGSPNLKAAKAENTQDFLRFDPVTAMCWTTSSPISTANAKSRNASVSTVSRQRVRTRSWRY